MFPEKYKELFEDFSSKNNYLFSFIWIFSFILSMLLVIVPFRLLFGPLELGSPSFFLMSIVATAAGLIETPYLMYLIIQNIFKNKL